MHSPFKFPYFAMTSYDLDRAQHLLIMGEIVDGHVDQDSVECHRFDLREARDAMYSLLGGKEKEVEEPVHGPVMFIETKDDSPIMKNFIESMDAIKRYIALAKDIEDEFAKSLAYAGATIDATEVIRLSEIRDDLVKDYPAVKLIRALNRQSAEKAIGRIVAGSQMGAASGPCDGYTSPNQGAKKHGKEQESEHE